jgi:hypothetical protein
VRNFLIRVITNYQKERKEGIITNFDLWNQEEIEDNADFIKIGDGSLGGKARGIAFVRYLLQKSMIKKSFQDINITIPFTAVIATDIFDQFMDNNRLHQLAYQHSNDMTIRDYFLRGFFPKEIKSKIIRLLKRIKNPIAVRSSSLLEDSQYQPFAGVYDTYILPNNQRLSMDERLKEILTAIKLVYASTFLQDAKNYMISTSSRIQEEKMAVIIQEAVGRLYKDKYFYPNISGVGQSYNFYPFRHIEPEDGLATIAMGFGRSVVEGESSFRFSPPYPNILPQFSTIQDILENSQKYFYALDIRQSVGEQLLLGEETMLKMEVTEGESHGTLNYIASTYNPQNDRIYPGIFTKGYRIITFSQILNSDSFPFGGILKEILKVSAKAMGTAVEIEFAVNFGKDGKKAEFCLLQIRPMVVGREFSVDFDEFDKNNILVSSTQAFGNGKVEGIKDIIYVKKDAFDRAKTPEIAKELGDLNKKMVNENIHYFLIGPGRWGSSDHWLGIPVKWSQISNASVIIETNLKDFMVDPSFGSHFFQNITSLGIYYLTIDINKQDNYIKWDYLDQMVPIHESKHVKYIRLSDGLTALTDGKKSRGIVLMNGKVLIP